MDRSVIIRDGHLYLDALRYLAISLLIAECACWACGAVWESAFGRGYLLAVYCKVVSVVSFAVLLKDECDKCFDEALVSQWKQCKPSEGYPVARS